MPLYRVKKQIEADVYVIADSLIEAGRYVTALDLRDDHPVITVRPRRMAPGEYVPKDHADSYPYMVDGTTCEKTVGELLMGEVEA